MSDSQNLIKTVETLDTSPFKKLVMTIGELPTSFVESMTYYEMLAWFCDYLQNTVIPTINNNAEVSEELQERFTTLNAKFNELHSYVENYFDNLDVQEEINNKIDQMVTDGYFVDLITPIAQDTLNELSADVRAGLVEAENVGYLIHTNEIRKDYFKKYSLVTLPESINASFFKDFNIFTNNKKNYTVNYDESKFKNTGGSTWYFAPTGNNANAGDREHPWKGMNATVWANISDGDTLIFLPGRYPKSTWSSSYHNKNLNVIGEGEVWFSTSDLNYTWDQYDTNIWHTTRSAIAAVYDITKLNEGITPALTLVNSISAVGTTPNSYFTDGSDVYVHMYDNIEPDNTNIELSLSLGAPFLTFTPDTDGKIYIENINCISASKSGILVQNNTHTINVLLKNCKLYNIFCNDYTQDGFTNQGCNSVCDNVHIINSKKDGFNYHAANSINANGIEINCTATNLGEGQTDPSRKSNNASTAHNGCQIVRVNGVYTYSNGGNVVDIDTVVSSMYNCTILDSYGKTYDAYAGGTATMYFYDCYFKGSSATRNLETNANSHIYYNAGTLFDHSSGNVELIN